MKLHDISWSNYSDIESTDYKCAYCDREIASQKGFPGVFYTHAVGKRVEHQAYIFICHHCTFPTLIIPWEEFQKPESKYGDNVSGIPDTNVKTLYDEARTCMSINAFTAVAMCCRIILMHVSVALGADKDKHFKYYVDYLNENGYIVKGHEDVVNFIKDQGNIANHQINLVSKKIAALMIDFTEMMLKNIYEGPSKLTIPEPEDKKTKIVVDTSDPVR